MNFKSIKSHAGAIASIISATGMCLSLAAWVEHEAEAAGSRANENVASLRSQTEAYRSETQEELVRIETKIDEVNSAVQKMLEKRLLELERDRRR